MLLLSQLTDADRLSLTSVSKARRKAIKAYNPDEMPKLSSPVIEFSGSTALLCVCNDSAAAKKLLTVLSANEGSEFNEIYPFLSEMLECGNSISFKPNGTSMLPLLRQGLTVLCSCKT